MPIMLIGFFLVKFDLINNLRNIEVVGWTTTNIWNYTVCK